MDQGVIKAVKDIIYASRDALPALVDCPSLDVTVSCSNWSVPPPSTRAPSQLEQLILRPAGRNEAAIQSAVSLLLQHIGHRLRVLTIDPKYWSISLGRDAANAISQSCPALEVLEVRLVDDEFIEQLVAALSTRPDACRVQRLTLSSYSPTKTFAALLATLRMATHSLTRSLRSLRFNCGYFGCEGEDLEQFITAVREMLSVNERLRDVTIHGLVSETQGRAGFSVVLAPLRHRLALLSALQHRGLPQCVLATVVAMTGHRVQRLRLESYDGADANSEIECEPNDNGYSS
ncbi:hypothetical protein P43SY_009215 [Pythium insidiosum]|uniref:Uncharacterized protein n=1 Tax=Pythium insidiosum TaxID=114742 RepID=A0AAD5M1F3_PYTIN|nr:hypothetical protein P43SY_009215 [Pythium insidiosum]